MAIKRCKQYMRNGWKFGKGTCHLYDNNNPKSQDNAKKRAEKDEEEHNKHKKPRLVELLNSFIGNI